MPIVDGRDLEVQLVFKFSKEWGSRWVSGSGSVEEVLYGFLLGLIEGCHTLCPQTC